MSLTPRFPKRPAGRFNLLLTAEEAFPALETLALEARRTLWLGFRVFDPTTRLHGPAREVAADWAGLIERKLEEGVEVRLLLSDFDALGRAELHRATWESLQALTEIARASRPDGLHLLPALHDAHAKGLTRLVLGPAAIAAVGHRCRELNELPEDARREAYAAMPGLWRAIRIDQDGQARWRIGHLPRLTPGTLHQKLAVADGEHAVIGGLDVDERRYDNLNHSRPAEETWHDASVLVEGPVADDIARHFAEQWNHHRARASEALDLYGAYRPDHAEPLPLPPAPCDVPAAKTDLASANDPHLQMLRTLSFRSREPGSSLFPRPAIRELLSAHLNLIRRARRLIYIETQFFRSRRIARALARAARANPDLGLILILPTAPEDIAFKGRLSLAERFGDHLQVRCLDKVTRAFGSRAAILSPARRVPDRQPGRQRIAGAEMIYVHAKVAVCDDAVAIVSSANLNGRSLHWDTEAGVLCTDQKRVAHLSARLQAHWYPASMPETGATGAEQAANWAKTAAHEATLAPAARTSLLVPHCTAAARQDAVPVPGAPGELV
ncbi:MAG: phospholipase D family protein [Pseudomonadota bacterium]